MGDEKNIGDCGVGDMRMHPRWGELPFQNTRPVGLRRHARCDHRRNHDARQEVATGIYRWNITFSLKGGKEEKYEVLLGRIGPDCRDSL